MEKLSFVLILVNVFVFSCSLLLNVLFGGYAAYLRLLLIAILWLFAIWLFLTPNCLSKRDVNLPNQGLLILLMCLTVMLIVSATVSRAPLIAIFYSIMPYFSFYPLVYLLLVVRRNNFLTKKLLIVFLILCNILAIGVIYDGVIGLENTPFISGKFAKALQEINTVDATGDRRGGFFFGSATSVYPFMSIGLLSAVIINKIFRDKNSIFLVYLSIPIIWMGCFFTFSRAPIILGTAFAAYAFLEMTFINPNIKASHKFFLVIATFLFTVLAPDLQSWLYEQMGAYHADRLGATLSSSDTGNSHRFLTWIEGMKLFNSTEAWRGYGLATSNIRMSQLYGFELKPQYESSILFTFSEGGIAGLIARLVPILITFWVCQNTRLAMLFSIWSLLFFINLFISPLINGHPVQLSYFLGMAMCVTLAPLLRRRNHLRNFSQRIML